MYADSYLSGFVSKVASKIAAVRPAPTATASFSPVKRIAEQIRAASPTATVSAQTAAMPLPMQPAPDTLFPDPSAGFEETEVTEQFVADDGASSVPVAVSAPDAKKFLPLVLIGIALFAMSKR